MLVDAYGLNSLYGGSGADVLTGTWLLSGNARTMSCTAKPVPC
jgi:hypothetical protein